MSFIKHRYETNPSVIIEGLIYATSLGLLTYILLHIVFYRSIFYTILALIFFYALLTTNNHAIKNFIKKVSFLVKHESKNSNKQ